MQFHILTLFPEMVGNALAESIIGRAQKDNKIGIETINIRDFANNKHNKVDDYTYGGGAGMLMQAQPVFDAYKSVEEKLARDCKKRVIYVTPQGHTFNQQMAVDFAKSDDVIIICGHYEGIDERVLEEVVTDYVSIGDYVLTGGELASMIIVDAVSRLVPGVLHNDASAETESFHGNLLEYPQYSRPEVWHEKAVPEVLLSGNQKEIDKWRLEKSIARTKERRPDLYARYEALQECREILLKKKLHHIDMIELINRGRAELVYSDETEILLKDMISGVFFHTSLDGEYNGVLTQEYMNEYGIECIVAHQRSVADFVGTLGVYKIQVACANAVYTQKERLSVTGLYRADGKPTKDGLTIRNLDVSYLEYATDRYTMDDAEYVEARLRAGDMFGAFIADETGSETLVGMAGFHGDGSIGMLFVDEEYRGRRIGRALETYVCNEALGRGWIPYGQVEGHNEKSRKLQESLGLYIAKDALYWVEKSISPCDS